MLGVLDFAVFEEATGSEEEVISAIPHALRHYRRFNADRLRALGCRPVTEHAFFGDGYDIDSGRLRKPDGVQAVAACQFAYAFAHPPYGLTAEPDEVQDVFARIRDFILPPSLRSTICDWSNAQLPDVSDYFDAGMEWWGVCLFSIHIPEIARLTIVAGSSTD